MFELGRDPLREPMRVIRAFFAPIIARALERRDVRREKGEKEEEGGEGVGSTLLDRLVDATDGEALRIDFV